MQPETEIPRVELPDENPRTGTESTNFGLSSATCGIVVIHDLRERVILSVVVMKLLDLIFLQIETQSPTTVRERLPVRGMGDLSALSRASQ